MIGAAQNIRQKASGKPRKMVGFLSVDVFVPGRMDRHGAAALQPQAGYAARRRGAGYSNDVSVYIERRSRKH